MTRPQNCSKTKIFSLSRISKKSIKKLLSALHIQKKIVQLAWSINTLIYVGHYCIRQYIKRGFLPSAATDKWKFISRISEQITQIIKSRLSFQLFKFYRDSFFFNLKKYVISVYHVNRWLKCHFKRGLVATGCSSIIDWLVILVCVCQL